MKKARAGAAQLARSVSSRRGKTPSEFQFDITVDRIFGIRAGSTYYVKWFSAGKVATTKHRQAGQVNARTGLPFEMEKMSLLITLYRDADAKNFDERDCKIYIVAATPGKDERIVAKAHFNIADFAGVPTSSTTKTFKLREPFSVKALVESRFVKSGKSGPGSAGASSTLSAIAGISGRSSDDEEEDDFDDLNIDDIPEPEETSKRSMSLLSASASRRSSMRNSGDTSSSSKRSTTAASDDRERPAESASKRGMFGKKSKNDSSGLAPSRSKRGLFLSRSKRGVESSDSTSGSVETASSKFGMGSLRGRSKRESAKPDFSDPASSPSIVTPSPRSTTSSGKRESREMERLRQDHDQMSADLRRSRDKLRRMESAHKEELDALRTSLGAARGAATAEDANLAKLTTRVDELEGENSRLKANLDQANREQESLRSKAANVDKLTRRNRDLSLQLDRQAAQNASRGAGEDNVAAVAALEERLARSRKEKEMLENKIQAHKAHAEKVRDTYEKLSTMYSSVREENIQLQQDLEAARAAAAAAAEAADHDDTGNKGDGAVSSAKVAALEAQLAPLQAQVRSANARAQDADSAKVQSEAELGRVRAQMDALQIKLDKAVAEARTAKRAEEEMRNETGDLKEQRDAALKRALSKRGKIGMSDSNAAATLSKIREESDREVSKARARVAELEEEVESLQEDVVYERAEKTKAREERDALRDSVRGLERRTSEAALQQDSIAALRRKLSTQAMREEDLTSMVTELRTEVKRLEAKHGVNGVHASTTGVDGTPTGGTTDETAEMLGVLVKTKLELAQAEDEKLALGFEMKQLKKSERAIQERLAAHASSLEVQLSQAKREIEVLRKKDGSSSPVSDF